jgi:hypothetical protein
MTALSHPPTVVVYGGTGFFGKLVVDDLLVRTTARIILAGRSKPRTASVNPRVTFTPSDLNDPASVRAALVGASVVVNCAGPYQSQGPALMHEAIASRVHYIDLAEDRAFVREAQRSHEAAKNAGVTLLSGLSVVPGLAALLARSIRDDFDELLSIRTFVAPGTRGSRGVATVRSLLSGVGRTLRLLREGRETIARGWSEPEWMEFPPPIGWRLQYLAIENADRDVLAREFGARQVEFKAGSEFPWLNRALALAARCRSLTGFPRLDRWASLLRTCLRWLGRFGTDTGGVLVEVTVTKSARTVTRQIALVADEQGERIPSLLAAIAVGALLRGELTARGAVPLSSWIAPQQLFHELRCRGPRLWSKSALDANWQPVPDKTETNE